MQFGCRSPRAGGDGSHLRVVASFSKRSFHRRLDHLVVPLRLRCFNRCGESNPLSVRAFVAGASGSFCLSTIEAYAPVVFSLLDPYLSLSGGFGH
jgi:hypothetical protein